MTAATPAADTPRDCASAAASPGTAGAAEFETGADDAPVRRFRAQEPALVAALRALSAEAGMLAAASAAARVIAVRHAHRLEVSLHGSTASRETAGLGDFVTDCIFGSSLSRDPDADSPRVSTRALAGRLEAGVLIDLRTALHLDDGFARYQCLRRATLLDDPELAEFVLGGYPLEPFPVAVYSQLQEVASIVEMTGPRVAPLMADVYADCVAAHPDFVAAVARNAARNAMWKPMAVLARLAQSDGAVAAMLHKQGHTRLAEALASAHGRAGLAVQEPDIAAMLGRTPDREFLGRTGPVAPDTRPSVLS